jgi:ABC-type lipoprotein export system ATPase subunit
MTICEKTGITKGTADALINMQYKDVMTLEHTKCDDIANIYLILEGQKKPLGDLSQGEKCTAILSVVLLDEHSPLIIDQPEDELDHNFIMANVVNTLGKVKQKSNPLDNAFSPKNGRQFIIATHNQNIPVLGDAEMILKMHKIIGEDKCELECGHGIEHPEIMSHVLSLEGGVEAFERRRRKYANFCKK